MSLIVDGDEHEGDVMESNRDITMPDLDEEVSVPTEVVLMSSGPRQPPGDHGQDHDGFWITGTNRRHGRTR